MKKKQQQRMFSHIAWQNKPLEYKIIINEQPRLLLLLHLHILFSRYRFYAHPFGCTLYACTVNNLLNSELLQIYKIDWTHQMLVLTFVSFITYWIITS